MPFTASVLSISSLAEVGPMVQMIFVLRVLRKPACEQQGQSLPSVLTAAI